MKENSFEWFSAQIKSVSQHVDATWPDWMKNTSDVATASFPVVGSIADKQEACSAINGQPVAGVNGVKLED